MHTGFCASSVKKYQLFVINSAENHVYRKSYNSCRRWCFRINGIYTGHLSYHSEEKKRLREISTSTRASGYKFL